MILKDTFLCELNDSQTSLVETLISDAKTNNKRKALEVCIDATHCGYVNKNFYMYTCDGMAEGSRSWIEPYEKPVLVHHEDKKDPVGRVKETSFVPIAADMNDPTAPKGKTRLKVSITDPEAIQKIKDQRYFTVSVSGRPIADPKCGICDKPVSILSSYFGPPKDKKYCQHMRGQKYDGKDCFWKIGAEDYSEISFVNKPADSGKFHVAKIASMKLVDVDDIDQKFIISEKSGSIKDKETAVEISKENKDLIDKIITLSKKEDTRTKLESTSTAELKEVLDALEKDSKAEEKPEEKKEEKAEEKTKDEKKEETVKAPEADGKDKEKVADGKDETVIPEETEDEKTWTSETLISLGDECKECSDAEVTITWTEEEEDEVMEMAREYDSFVRIVLDVVLPAVGTKARKNMKAKFCGPNKTFPVTDCKHAATALAYLNFPRVKAKYSSDARTKIKSCVMGASKSLGCASAKTVKKDSISMADVQALIDSKINEFKVEIDKKDVLLLEKQKETRKILIDQIILKNAELKLEDLEKKSTEELKTMVEIPVKKIEEKKEIEKKVTPEDAGKVVTEKEVKDNKEKGSLISLFKREKKSVSTNKLGEALEKRIAEKAKEE